MNASIAYIALGANLGDRRANLDRALAILGAMHDLRVTKVSSFYDNPAVGGPPGSPPFLNSAAEIDTSLLPRDLLACLLEVEHQLGRKRREKWGPRLIDLDLLLYGDEVIAEADLTIPHPLMQDRRFVLQPLAEIAPGVRHPTLGATIAELLRRCG